MYAVDPLARLFVAFLLALNALHLMWAFYITKAIKETKRGNVND